MAASYRPADDENLDDGVVAEINITPLTDVFLVLLIIFMVTTSVVANQSKNVDLPGAEVSDTTPQGVTVTVTPDGRILVGETPATSETLYAVLEEALGNSREKLVILRGDKRVLLGQAVNILDVAQQAGARGIALATQPNPKSG
ncbi:MAG: biopolymer transporter ExbD [Myxococcales bacterium]|nr:biopolymer transporter ExbD [Myxococcales bacterium]MDH5306674.1 biopolymer transporter ExbD [Myxococcales bacterium]MDH5567097.1 biopolymer transporter ExbD [Myxococcales bacterium]